MKLKQENKHLIENESVCILPWIHLETTATGFIKPCCLSKDYLRVDNKKINLDTTSIKDIFHCSQMEKLRTAMLKGEKPSNCVQCWELEKIGKESKRQVANKNYKNQLHKIHEKITVPTTLDLKLGTICNLKCRSCDSYSSFKWREDEELLYGRTVNPNRSTNWIDDQSLTWKELEELIPTLEYLEITGGEPFLIKKHFDFLQKCVEKGQANKITVHYNTNGTVKITDRMINIWKNFAKVSIMFSIDGINEKFEYLRFPGQWTDVVANIQSLMVHKDIFFHICCTVSIFNVLYLNDLYKLLDRYKLSENRLYFNMVFEPSYLCIKNFPLPVKQKIKDYLYLQNPTEKITEVINFMLLENKNNLLHRFLYLTEKLDTIRNQSWENTFPELATFIKKS